MDSQQPVIYKILYIIYIQMEVKVRKTIMTKELFRFFQKMFLQKQASPQHIQYLLKEYPQFRQLLRMARAFLQQKGQQSGSLDKRKKRKQSYNDIWNTLPEKIEYVPKPQEHINQSIPQDVKMKVQDTVINISSLHEKQQNPILPQELFDDFLQEINLLQSQQHWYQ